MIAFLLHAANRNVKGLCPSEEQAFYRIKDIILKKFGNVVGYDVQYISGKKCHSCDGTGLHPRYSNRYPYKPYDYDSCWHCHGGWYKFPKWIMLDKIQLGRYIFHRPVQRLECIRNPYPQTKKTVEGYIEHKNHWFGDYAIGILFLFLDFKMFKFYASDAWRWKTYKIRWFFHNWFKLETYIVKPAIPFKWNYLNDDGTWDDLPF